MSAGFARLVDLARETTSDGRRELLREVTDMFFATREERTPQADRLFDDILRDVAKTMQDEVLRALAERFADVGDAPQGLIKDLASSSFAVAEPILRRSPLLQDAELVSMIEGGDERHRRAIAERAEVSEAVSNALVEQADDDTLAALAHNKGAKLSRRGYEHLFERARQHEGLTSGVVGRVDAPLDLLNEIVLAVSSELRSQILARNASVSPEELDLALERARGNLNRRSQAAPQAAAFAEAEADVQRRINRGQFNAGSLVAYYREGQMSHFIVGLAHMTGVDVDVTQAVIGRGDMDALAMMCRAGGIERPLFVTIAVLACGGQRAMGRAEEYGRLYAEVPVEAAQRAMRFYKVRRANAPAATAVA
jgi:uncharacterized protein (DUF2336 family)